jgi:hypothetical protein
MTVGSVKDAAAAQHHRRPCLERHVFLMREHVFPVGTTSTTSTAAVHPKVPTIGHARFETSATECSETLVGDDWDHVNGFP